MNLKDLGHAIALKTNLEMKKNVPKKLEILSPRYNIVDIRSSRKRRSCVKSPRGGEEEGDQEEKKRKTRERSQRQRESQSYMKLRSHRNKTKHFTTVDHSKEEDSPDAENNNEKDEAGAETNVRGGENMSEDELDLRLELDEEELQALREEAK